MRFRTTTIAAALLVGATLTTGTASASPWTEPTVAASSRSLHVESPSLAVNASGGAVLTWACERPSDTRGRVYALCGRLRLADGSLTPTRVIVEPDSARSYPTTSAVIDDAGVATVVWSMHTFGEVNATRILADGRLGESYRLGGGAGGALLTVDDQGDVTALWRYRNSLAESHVRVLHADGSMAPSTTLSTGVVRALVADPDGGAVALSGSGETERHNRLVLNRIEDGVVGPEQVVTVDATDEYQSSDLVVTDDGTVTIAWWQGTKRAARIYTRRFPVDGAPTAPAPITATLAKWYYLRLTTVGGQVYAAWNQDGSDWSATLRDDQRATTPQRIGSGYNEVDLAATSDEAVFLRFGDDNRKVLAQTWDGSGAPSRPTTILADPTFDNEVGDVGLTFASTGGWTVVATARWMETRHGRRAYARLEATVRH